MTLFVTNLILKTKFSLFIFELDFAEYLEMISDLYVSDW